MAEPASAVIPLRATRVLLVEDNPSDAFLLDAQLQEVQNTAFAVTRAGSEASALQALTRQNFDVCLLDLSLPDAVDLSALTSLQEKAPRLPILILTGTRDEELARQAVASGAQDYLMKDYAGGIQIGRAIDYAMERKRFEGNLMKRANFDSLTGLANRDLFEDRLEMALARVRRKGSGLAVLFIDLDRFKQVNDQLGHKAGDEVLREAGQRLSRIMRVYDTVARFGGDEFAVLLESINNPRDCVSVAQKIIEALSVPHEVAGQAASVGASIGIATAFADGPSCTTEEIVRFADTAMYRAKAQGAGNYQFYTPLLHAETRARMLLEQDLRGAMAKDQFHISYLPRLAAQTGTLAGAEALLRWEHPMRGLMLPADFMALADDAGLSAAIGRWVMERVCRDLAAWSETTLPPLQIAVNISGAELEAPGCAEALERIITESGVDARRIALEVREEALLREADRKLVTLSRLHALGVSIHLDNFGSGAFSLHTLRRFPLDLIKLDGALVRHIGHSAKDAELVYAAIGMAHRLGLEAAACGVETQQQKEKLTSHACDEVQGFAIARSMSAKYLTDWAVKNRIFSETSAIPLKEQKEMPAS